MNNIFDDFINKVKSNKNNNNATVVYLEGDLGSGKTTFTKNLCKYLNLDVDITSPTFTILKKYDFHIEGFENLIHIDAYRLKSYEDLLKIKFEAYLKDKKNIIFIEWPSVVENENIKPDIILNFEHDFDSGGRNIEIK